jgi:hypothetical protein
MEEAWVIANIKESYNNIDYNISALENKKLVNPNQKENPIIGRLKNLKGEDIVNGDKIHVDRLLDPVPDEQEYDLHDLKNSWRDEMTISELEIRNDNITIRDNIIKYEPEEIREILNKIIFSGDMSFQEKLIQLCF